MSTSAAVRAVGVYERGAVITALSDKVYPARVLLIAEPLIGPPAVVVLQPPSVQLQGTIAAHILTALDSARSSAAADGASGAKARGRLESLEWAGAKLNSTPRQQPPATVVSVDGASPGGEHPVEFEVVEATELARLIDKFDPRWLSLLLGMGDTLYTHVAWRSLIKAEGAPTHAHAHLLRKVARQAYGRCQSLMQRQRNRRKKPEVERTPEEVAAEWRAIGGLLSLGAKVAAAIGVAVEAPPTQLLLRVLTAQAGAAATDGEMSARAPAASETAGAGGVNGGVNREPARDAVAAAVAGEGFVASSSAISEADGAAVMALCEAQWAAAEEAGKRLPPLLPAERSARRAWLEAWVCQLHGGAVDGVTGDALLEPYYVHDPYYQIPKGGMPSSTLEQPLPPPSPPPPPAALEVTLRRLEAPIEVMECNGNVTAT